MRGRALTGELDPSVSAPRHSASDVSLTIRLLEALVRVLFGGDIALDSSALVEGQTDSISVRFAGSSADS